MSAAEDAAAARSARVGIQARVDVAVLAALSILGILGFETSFGGTGFLVAGIGGLAVGIAAGLATYRFGLNGILTALAAIVLYFVVGTPIAVPSQGIGVVLPSLRSLGDLATGAVYGWGDVLTLKTPIGAPAYIAAVPYVSGWLVGLVFTTLAVRWLARRPRTAPRYALLLAGPVALYIIGVLTGTDEPFLAGVRGIAFAIIALAWLGWRRSNNRSASGPTSRDLVRRKVIGSVIVIALAALVAGCVGVLVPPTSYNRFVLRDKITPPFDPLDYASPLAGFRHYTKAAASEDLFTVTGLKPGDRIRIATMDSYTGQLWNVVGSDVSEDGSGSFDLVGSRLPAPKQTTSPMRTVQVTVDGYSDAWIPVVGDPETLTLGGTASGDGDELRYNSVTGTAALTDGIGKGMRFTVDTRTPKAPSASELEKLAPADIPLPAADHVPDVITAQAQLHGGSGTPYERLTALSKYLHDNGQLSHGDGLVPSAAGHGANRMIQMFPPNGTLVGDAEQFASAFALMARSYGYPARVVMGFAPTVQAGASSVTVVGKNVTAWDEVDFAKVGWVSFDPTPTQTGTPPNVPPPPQSQSVQQSRQPQRSTQPQNDVLSPVAINKQKPRTKPFALPGWVYSVGGGVLGLAVLYFVPLLVIGLVKRRRRARRRNRGSGGKRVAGAWDELLDNYAELGLRVPRRRTRLDVARAVQPQVTLPAQWDEPSLIEVAATTDQAVFSGTAVSDDRVEAAWSTAARQIALARRSVGRGRRWLGQFRVHSKRGLPDSIMKLDATTVTERVKSMVSR